MDINEVSKTLAKVKRTINHNASNHPLLEEVVDFLKVNEEQKIENEKINSELN